MPDPDPGRSALPSPEDLKNYDVAHPGLGRQIIEMVQEEQRHLHYMERAEISLGQRGQIFGFIISISFLVVSAILVALGHSVAGTVIGSVDLVALTTVFVVGRRSQEVGPGPRQADSTDRLIRELRRAQPKGIKARKARKRDKPAISVTEKPTRAAASESSPTVDVDNVSNNSSPSADIDDAPDSEATAEGASSIHSDIPVTPPISTEDSLDPASNESDTLGDDAKSPVQLTEEDIELYRKLYNDSRWNPG
jgi:uncharacterized membrane protein